MLERLTMSCSALRTAADRLTRNPTATVRCAVGVSRVSDERRWLVHLRPTAWSAASSLEALINGATSGEGFDAALRRAAISSSDREYAVIAFGLGPAAGYVAAIHIREDGSPRAFGVIEIVGPGMPRIPLRGPGSSGETPPGIEHRNQPLETTDRWSRTIGALGEAAWRRLTDLHISVVGCGRSGSLVATSLRRLGVTSLTMIDPDNVEPHNLGEMDGVSTRDLGAVKVNALRDFLARCDLAQGPSPVTVAASVLSLSALTALKTTDLLFCCVDNAAARLATAFLSTVYLKPLIDVGTGISHEAVQSTNTDSISLNSQTAPRVMGADVRLILPGRCLLCLGGLANVDQARRELLDSSPPTPRDSDWRRQRAGSLRSLNGLAVHLALRLLEDFVGGRVTDSTWLHLDYSDRGIPNIEHRYSPENNGCPLCALCGSGDGGLGHFQAIVRRLDRFANPSG